MRLDSKRKNPGLMLAGIFSLALTSVVLLCGAGYVPVENFAPQGPMQTDLNAGGHSLTNAATVSATNIAASGSMTVNGQPVATMSGTVTSATYSGFATNAGTASTATSAMNLTGTITPAQIAPTVGTGTQVVLGSVGAGVINANSVVIVLGDSLAAGYPIVNLSGTPDYQVSYAGPGYCWAQWLSTLPQFRGIPIYSFGVGSTRSADLASELNGSETRGTKYINGAVVGAMGASRRTLRR